LKELLPLDYLRLAVNGGVIGWSANDNRWRCGRNGVTQQ